MIHISGSIAYDRIMTFPGKFEDHILPEKLHILNVSFQVDRVIERRGGTAGNIAYNLALLGEKPYVYTSVGSDFTQYAKAFEYLGIPLDFIHVEESAFTASCYINTDLVANQITAFSPAAMAIPLNPAFYPKPNKEKDWAIISPGNIDDMISLARYYAENGTKTIFDPGQQIVVFPHEHLSEAVDMCEILIGNDYEITKICSNLNLSRQELASKVPYLITTYGEKGSSVEGKNIGESIMVPAIKIENVQDPTGCGDAYRAGLLKGIHCGLDIVESMQIASTIASYCVEQAGTQEHMFSEVTFKQRYAKQFGIFPSIDLALV